MSSELIEDVEDEAGASVMLAMTVHKCAFLSINDTRDSVAFCLIPSPEGIRHAKAIENALAEWRRFVSEE